MIIVYNSDFGQIFGFDNLEEYKTWMLKQNEILPWDNTVYEINSGEECREDKVINMSVWIESNYSY